MPRLEISILPIDGIADFSTSSLVSSLIILSKEKGSLCRITSTGTIIDCDRDTMLQILKELDGFRFDILAKKFTISVDFRDRHYDRISRAGTIADDLSEADGDTMNREIISARPRKEMIHNMVL